MDYEIKYIAETTNHLLIDKASFVSILNGLKVQAEFDKKAFELFDEIFGCDRFYNTELCMKPMIKFLAAQTFDENELIMSFVYSEIPLTSNPYAPKTPAEIYEHLKRLRLWQAPEKQ